LVDDCLSKQGQRHLPVADVQVHRPGTRPPQGLMGVKGIPGPANASDTLPSAAGVRAATGTRRPSCRWGHRGLLAKPAATNAL
jgi:hypothetical protein